MSAVVIPFPARETTRDAWVEDVFGDAGVLAKANPGYEQRPGQIALARAVAQALDEKRHALLEGPCGTGKGIAYLVPVIRWVQANPGKRVVIATETIALQEQLVSKDLPFLASVMPGGFRFALAKGRGQYLCNDAFAAWDAKAGRFALSDAENALRAWGRTTDSGSRTSLPIAVPDRAWSKVTVDSDECKGKDCPRREECFYEGARAAIKDAQIIVANYKLLCLHLALVGEGVDPKALPLGEFHALVADEAHGLVDVARDTFGATITEHTFTRTLNFAREYMPDGAAKRLEDAASGFFGGLREWVDGHAPESPRGPSEREDATRIPLDTEPLFPVSLDPLGTELSRVSAWAAAMVAKLEARERASGPLDGEEREARARARSTMKRTSKHLTMLSLFASASTRCAAEAGADRMVQLAARYALWVELDRSVTGERAVRLEARKVDVRDTLNELLWSEIPCVLTSATLTVEGRFDHIERETGLDAAGPPARGSANAGGHSSATARGTIRLEVPSPFDFASRCMAIVPNGLPEPNDPAWRAACAQVIGAVAQVADGRTLALFSSTSAMDAAHRVVSARGRGARVWMRQGEAPSGELARRLKSDPRSVLFGTKSFMTGIDVPGDALIAVVIDRVPFTPPTDPVVRRLHALLEARGLNPFQHCDLPRAIMLVKQAFGRLIRTREDYGVVVLLDTRMNSSRWARAVWRSLPTCARGTQLAEVRAHLDRFRLGTGAVVVDAPTPVSAHANANANATGTEGTR